MPVSPRTRLNPTQRKATDEQIIAGYKALIPPTQLAKQLGIAYAVLARRRRQIEAETGEILPVVDKRAKYNTADIKVNKAVHRMEIENGTILIANDFHIWPGMRTVIQRAFVLFAKKLKPTAIILNGDIMDFPTISRHAALGWEKNPTVWDEIQTVQEYLGELIAASKASKRVWCKGNHDGRLEQRLATVAVEYRNATGFHLKDHFPEWTPCWRVDINDDVVVRHREMGGEHADFRNAQTAGKHVVTGHDHRIGWAYWRNYRGMHYGIRGGYGADSPQDPQFQTYLEAREPNWCPGFPVLTFREGRLMVPEFVKKWDVMNELDNRVEFRGELFTV